MLYKPQDSMSTLSYTQARHSLSSIVLVMIFSYNFTHFCHKFLIIIIVIICNFLVIVSALATIN